MLFRYKKVIKFVSNVQKHTEASKYIRMKTKQILNQTLNSGVIY